MSSSHTPSKHSSSSSSSSSSSKKDKGDKDGKKKKTKSVSFIDALACAVYPDLMGPKLKAAHRGSKSHKSKSSKSSSSKSSSSKSSSSKSAGGDDDVDKDSADEGENDKDAAGGDQVSYHSARFAARTNNHGSNVSHRSGGRYEGTTMRNSAPYLDDAGSRVTSFYNSHPQGPPIPRCHYSSHHSHAHEADPFADQHSQASHLNSSSESSITEAEEETAHDAFFRREQAAYTAREADLLLTAEQWHTRMAAWTGQAYSEPPPLPPAAPFSYHAHTEVNSVAPSDSISVAHLRRRRRDSVVAPSDSISVVAESRASRRSMHDRGGRASHHSRHSRE